MSVNEKKHMRKFADCFPAKSRFRFKRRRQSKYVKKEWPIAARKIKLLT